MAHKNGKADGGEGSVGEMRSTLAALPQMSSTFFKNWCLCVCVGTCRGQGRVSDPLELGLHVVVNYFICMLGNVLESFERVSGLNHVSSLLTLFFET